MLALDPNDPNQACLMAGGDCINKIAPDAVLELEAAVKSFRSAIPSLVDEMATKHNLHPHFVWWALFRPKQWPSMSSKDKDMLWLAQQVFEASGAWRPSSLSPFSGNPGWTVPADLKTVDAMFRDMVKTIRTYIGTPLLRRWATLSVDAIRKIQSNAEEDFGFP